jgi:hypothetical protein
MIFESEHWPLHTALAWVLTRDRRFTESFLAWPHYPRLDIDDLFPAVDMHWSWKELFTSVLAGEIPVLGRPTANLELPQKQLSKEDLTGLDWANPREVALALNRSRLRPCNKSISVPGLRRRAAMRFNETQEFTIPDGIAFIDVSLDAAAVQRRFPPGSKAIACDSREYGAPEPATGPGFMDLTSAAYLIATEGGLHNFFLRDNEEWAKAYQDLLSHVARDNVEIIGRPAGTAFHQKLDGKLFSSVSIRFFLDDPKAIDFRDQPVVDCSHPKTATCRTLPYFSSGSRCDGDQLIVDRNVVFSNLKVLKSDIAVSFPFVEVKRKALSKRSTPSGAFVSTGGGGSKPRAEGLSQEKCERLYLDWIKLKTLQGEVPSEKEDAAHFSKFGKAGRKLRRFIRGELAPESWKKPGRRPQKA